MRDLDLRSVLARKWHSHTAVASLALPTLAGCAKMDAALSQQWVDVTFKPGTSVAQQRSALSRG
jgi:hypothetical protein